MKPDFESRDMNCRSTGDSHVKTNLVHTLYCVQKYGLLPLEKFVEMLRPSEKKRCVAVQPGRKHWYSMPIEVFMAFVFQVRCVVYFLDHTIFAIMMMTMHWCLGFFLNIPKS